MNFVYSLKKCYNNKSGYIVLVTVLLIGAAGLSIAVSIILLGLGQSRDSASTSDLQQAMSLANACAEEGLQQIRDSDVYAGTEMLTIGNGTCIYSVINQGGDNREVQAVGTVNQVSRRVKVNTSSLAPTITISSWQELSDF